MAIAILPIAWARRALLLLACAAFALATTEAHGQEAPVPSPPTHWVEDHAGFLSPSAASALDARLRDYERQTGHQIVVWIGKTSGATPIEDYAVRTFKAFKLGRKGLDDGLLMLVLAEDRKIDIEVGYGLEDRVPDVIAKRIIEDVMIPRIRADDRDGAISEGVTAVLAAIEGKAPPPGEQRGPATAERPSKGQLVLFGIIGFVILVFFITHPSLALQFLFVMMSGRGGGFGGGSGFGGGGFSGGGGRSGGGGARGSW